MKGFRGLSDQLGPCTSSQTHQRAVRGTETHRLQHERPRAVEIKPGKQSGHTRRKLVQDWGKGRQDWHRASRKNGAAPVRMDRLNWESTRYLRYSATGEESFQACSDEETVSEATFSWLISVLRSNRFHPEPRGRQPRSLGGFQGGQNTEVENV